MEHSDMTCDTLNRIEPPIANDDELIFSLFRDWQAAERAATALPSGAYDSPEDVAYQAALEHAEDVLYKIADVPAAGLAAFVLKAFLYAHCEHGSASGPEPCALRAFFKSEENYSSTPLLQSILEDAARFLPELAPLVERAISDVRIPDLAEIVGLERAQRLAAVVDRVAAAEREAKPRVIGFGEPDDERLP
jgi:hypothetical protein